MKFLVDMQLSPALADWLAGQGHEAAHVHAVGLGKAPDDEILRRAARESEIVVTCDLDFPRLLALAGSSGPAVILLRGGDYGEAEVRELLGRVLRTLSADELSGSIVVVDRKRVRLHRLPL